MEESTIKLFWFTRFIKHKLIHKFIADKPLLQKGWNFSMLFSAWLLCLACTLSQHFPSELQLHANATASKNSGTVAVDVVDQLTQLKRQLNKSTIIWPAKNLFLKFTQSAWRLVQSKKKRDWEMISEQSEFIRNA